MMVVRIVVRRWNHKIIDFRVDANSTMQVHVTVSDCKGNERHDTMNPGDVNSFQAPGAFWAYVEITGLGGGYAFGSLNPSPY